MSDLGVGHRCVEAAAEGAGGVGVGGHISVSPDFSSSKGIQERSPCHAYQQEPLWNCTSRVQHCKPALLGECVVV